MALAGGQGAKKEEDAQRQQQKPQERPQQRSGTKVYKLISEQQITISWKQLVPNAVYAKYESVCADKAMAVGSKAVSLVTEGTANA